MRKILALTALCTLATVVNVDGAAQARSRHHRRAFVGAAYTHYGTHIRYGSILAYGTPPLSATTGVPIPPYAARFMGYPYNVPGYRYQYADGCLLRVGGVFGPGPSIAPCPFGLDRPF